MPLRPLLPLSALLVACAAFGADAAPARYCNPLPLPDYPVGRLVRDLAPDKRDAPGGLWLTNHAEQYRELADPSAVWFEGKWYLYPSCDLAWVSADEGRTWEHHPLNIRDVGYAPTVVRHNGRFLLMASDSAIYTSDSPLGPFESIGRIVLPKITGLPGQTDPMLFSDGGRLFYYWGCTPHSGIWGVELDAANPTKLVSEPKELIPFRPDLFPWEAVGSHNQNPNNGWMEGSWMVKRGNRYYLTYSAGGTQYRTYAMGCYTSDSPLGPFVPQQRNPIFRTTEGLVTGTGHGSIAEGPEGHYWVFYTVFAGVVHGFERRLGMDLVEFDANGEIYVPRATSTPQALPSAAAAEAWYPLNESEPTFGSTSDENSSGRFAADNSLQTYWLPDPSDPKPVLTTAFSAPAMVHGARVVWRDVGLDTTAARNPGPFRYRIEGETAPGIWTTLIDRSASTEDLLVDYRECAPTKAARARLVILGHPTGIEPAVTEFTVFGTTVR